jgi:hypothetical protein
MFPDLTPAVKIVALTMFAIKVWELHRDGHIFKKLTEWTTQGKETFVPFKKTYSMDLC